MKVRTGNIDAARSDAQHACDILRAIVAQEPENIPRRIQLAQGYIFLAESGQALDVLCDALPESIDTSIDSALVDAMSKTYSVWLSLMTERQQTIQRTCLIRLAALPSQAEPAESSERITSAESATPKDAALSDAAFFASVVRSPRRSVVIPFLRGTIAAADGNFSVAEERLRTALSHAADDPSINNNLAWILLQKLHNVSDKDARTAALDEALLLSMHSIESAPSIPEFRETHARILANIGKHELAVNEFRRCLAMGLNNRQIHKSLAASLSILGHAHEAAQHELEAHNSTLE